MFVCVCVCVRVCVRVCVILVVPSSPQVTGVVLCDRFSRSFSAELQWSGDTSHTHYQVKVISPAGFVCPPEQCNITTTTTTITGLSCDYTNYSFAITAVNCVGESNATTITLPVEGKFSLAMHVCTIKPGFQYDAGASVTLQASG